MGLFFMSEVPAPPVSHLPDSARNRLIGLLQDGRSLERYVEEFVELAYLTNWPDACLNALFLEELDESIIGFDEPDDYFSLDDTINLILYLNGFKFVVEEVPDMACNSRSVPLETQAVWPVRQSPSSSTYPSSELFPCVLPDPQPSVGSGRSKRRKRKKAKQPNSPEFSASVQPKPLEFPAAEPAPVLVGLLVEFEGMDWTPFPDPAPCTAEPAHFYRPFKPPLGASTRGWGSRPSMAVQGS
ncbi:hypothetical protein DPX16_6730 [Anabarilius grahami]|uniref:Retrotransposon gag domain-containing protein n=1 Tax=Anabarilius grahami TaxID=495550 RepID=A0A3N0Y559_ANAGA|nr:hypothetical protein DPX16_6730 [Anabarilius grahami]